MEKIQEILPANVLCDYLVFTKAIEARFLMKPCNHIKLRPLAAQWDGDNGFVKDVSWVLCEGPQCLRVTVLCCYGVIKQTLGDDDQYGVTLSANGIRSYDTIDFKKEMAAIAEGPVTYKDVTEKVLCDG